jgi:hypothetical protein
MIIRAVTLTERMFFSFSCRVYRFAPPACEIVIRGRVNLPKNQ